MLRIALTYDLRDDYLKMGYTLEQTAEFDRADTIEAIERELVALGHEVERVGHLRALVDRLAAGHRWDLVFNICEGLDGFGRESQVPALLEAYRIPCTFSDSLVNAMTLHKGFAKRVVLQGGYPTPAFAVVESAAEIDAVKLQYPLFVKPVAEGTGKGVHPFSRVDRPEELRFTALKLIRKYRQPAIIEEFLPGREFTVGLVGTGSASRAIGVMEVILRPEAEAFAYSYANKENYEELVRYQLVEDAAAKKCAKLALDIWKLFGCRDAGRMDFRCDARGVPNFMEVNPLAGLHPGHSDLPILCNMVGISYRDLIARILESAMRRAGRQVVRNPVRRKAARRNAVSLA